MALHDHIFNTPKFNILLTCLKHLLVCMHAHEYVAMYTCMYRGATTYSEMMGTNFWDTFARRNHINIYKLGSKIQHLNKSINNDPLL